MGSLQIMATLQPPMLCLDECVAADSLEVDIGDLCMAPAPPAPSLEIGDHAVKLKVLKALKTKCNGSAGDAPPFTLHQKRSGIQAQTRTIPLDNAVPQQAQTQTLTI